MGLMPLRGRGSEAGGILAPTEEGLCSGPSKLIECGTACSTLQSVLQIYRQESSNLAPCYLLRRAENLVPHKNLLMEVLSSLPYNHPNLEATKILLSGWMDKEAVIHSDNGTLFSTDRN